MVSRRRSTAPLEPVAPGSPFLTSIGIRGDRVEPGRFPFTIPIVSNLSLTLNTPITFLVGENGSGKSTLLEALAWAVGFGAHGGNRDHTFVDGAEGHALGRALTLSWRQRTTEGFFLRAETFYNFASELENVGSSFRRYGGTSFIRNRTARHSSHSSSIGSRMACSSSTSPKQRSRRSGS
jgi:predicted ATPase